MNRTNGIDCHPSTPALTCITNTVRTNVSSFASVNNVAANYWESDSYTNQFFDGLGRVFAVASNHPGSTGGNKAQYIRYDEMGRAAQQTNPFEIDSGWNPTGDDSAGYQFNVANTFDWKGRPLRTYNMDGTYKEASYAGCGCAGGEVVTLTDEVARQQKVYSDVLGRQWKTEVLNDNSTIYSTTTNTFNARDQVRLVRQWARAENDGGAYQDTTMAFDGYGRLQSKHVPEQNGATTYAYNYDDTVYSVTDAHGAVATYGYNNRHQVTSATHVLSGQPTVTASYGYDAAGNRTSMNDGSGSTTYTYDQLSRMISETHNITGLGAAAISYQYNLASQLTLVTSPDNVTVNYGHDSVGRVSSVTGYGASAASNFATDLRYRAWGGLKHLNYGNGKTLEATYNSRLLPASFQVSAVMSKTYDYNADGQLHFSSDAIDHRFDRLYLYDRAARITNALSGAEARGEGASVNRPYWESFGYDAFDHLTGRGTYQWTSNQMSTSDSYSNNRHVPVGSNWEYDADGRPLAAG